MRRSHTSSTGHDSRSERERNLKSLSKVSDFVRKESLRCQETDISRYDVYSGDSEARSNRLRNSSIESPIFQSSSTTERSNASENKGVSKTRDFSFVPYKRLLNDLFCDHDVLDDTEDFWKFLKKYESMQEKAGGIESCAASSNELLLPAKYDKKHYVCLSFATSVDKLFSQIQTYSFEEPLSHHKFLHFCDIVHLYMDFKQREKFRQLCKLRHGQKNLPVYQFRDEIITSVLNNRVVIIAGDTGCGKSTQVPQFLLKAGYKRIACTQPRRIACISLSKRVAYETLNEYGTDVGYQIRFEKNKTQKTKILFITEGLLLRQVPGRLHPIKLHYRPISIEEKSSKGERINPAPYVRILHLIDEKYAKDEKGDVLIFLSGMSEISTIVEAVQEYNKNSQNWVVLPLHSTLSLAEQDKVFDYPPDGVRKCIVSTNIAETSVTIDGVRFVVDSGKVKEMSYDPACKLQRLKEFWISRASAEQRKGRAGRTGPGVCFRLYSEEEYSAMDQYSTPEIQRVPLDSLLLQMVAMGLPDARKFPFIEAPPAESIENSILSLKQQGALGENEKLTTIGRMLSCLPVDIALGKILIMGSLFHQVEPVLSLAAALSVQTPFTNRAYRDPDCELARKELESDHGDPIILLNALREWLEVKSSGSRSSSRQWCRRRGLEEQRFYEMIKLRQQFKDLLQESGLLKTDPEPVKNMSSSERALRHGELKLLKSLQRSYREAGPRKKKRLKLDVWQIGEEDGNEPGDIDIRDVEFRLRNTTSQVQDLLSGATACSYKDLMMLKLIIVSGLYPQLAIADEFNYCKSVAEQLYHTKDKPYVSLHPMGFFGNHPQVLQLQDSDIVTPEDSASTSSPISSKHQVLCYLSLLETTKPYLVSTLRMPAAHTLLLFSQAIDTNEDFTKLVCDSWIQLKFPMAESAAKFLLKSTQLRTKWEQLLNLKLNVTLPSIQQEDDVRRTMSQLEDELSVELPGFMHLDVCYSIKRLLAADRKVMYVGSGGHSLPIQPNPFSSDWVPELHPVKGGVRVTPHITYNCIVDTETDMMSHSFNNLNWQCPYCEMNLALSVLEQLQHLTSCQPAKHQKGPDESPEDTAKIKPNSQAYYCDVCQKEMYLKPTEILRHRKQHVR
ncbi:probable ATP-dependent RNA helicase DHX34 isoform X2 [Anabrus simplex]|uniref:probable ATP-dependent RNA helicase DHX34 isoform X2 n=1 Tax=Anabrus simplex TaxID=316456 RepID=UPI0035A38E53